MRPGEYLTIEEVALKLKRPVRWVRKRIGEGVIKAHRLSARVRMVSERDFQDYLRSCEPVSRA